VSAEQQENLEAILSGLPPLIIQPGTDEVLLDDARVCCADTPSLPRSG